MRKAFCGLGALVLLAGAVAPALADLHFPREVVDAGSVKSGRPLAQRFTFVNSGTEPVEVVEVRPSCGCLRPKLSKRVYQPGEKGEITLAVHTLGEAAGPHRWTLQVASVSSGQRRAVTLAVTARVVTEVTIRPASLVIHADSPIEHEIVLTDLRSRTLHIREVRGSSPAVKARVVEEFLDPNGHTSHRVALQVGADYPEGRHDDTVSILTNDLIYRELKVPVTVVKRGRQRVTALPASVDLRAPATQAAPSRIVLLEDRQNEAVAVERVEADHPALVCQWARGPGNRATLRVSVDRTKVTGQRIDATVRVQVASPVRETLSLPVRCVLEGSGKP